MAKSAFSDDKGFSVDSELVVGDKDHSQELQVGNRSEQRANTIQNVNETPALLLFLLVLGWLLPSPVEMWRGFIKLLPWVE